MPNAEDQLWEDGYVVLPDFFDPPYVTALRHIVEALYLQEGDFAGAEFRQEVGCRRLANLVNKHPLMAELVNDHRMLALVRVILGEDIKLSSLNARSAEPMNRHAQPLHADMGALPDTLGPWVCNCVWMLDDFSKNNGALRVVPGSHQFGQLPQDVLDHPEDEHPDEVVVTGTAGTLVVLNAHLWHAGRANETRSPRRAIHAFYTRRDKPQQQLQEQLLDPEVIAGLSPQQRHLLAIGDSRNAEVTRANKIRSGFLRSRAVERP